MKSVTSPAISKKQTAALKNLLRMYPQIQEEYAQEKLGFPINWVTFRSFRDRITMTGLNLHTMSRGQVFALKKLVTEDPDITKADAEEALVFRINGQTFRSFKESAERRGGQRAGSHLDQLFFDNAEDIGDDESDISISSVIEKAKDLIRCVGSREEAIRVLKLL